jgi:two-component system chemotaxis response regulator CheY
MEKNLQQQITKSKHILIVDDSLDNQELIKMLLEAKGYTADCMSNGEEALALLKITPRLPDTILLDLRMPVMDGFDFWSHQRANPLIKHIPVVIMSGEKDTQAFYNQVNTEILMKPLNISSLMDAVERNCRSIDVQSFI